ARKFGFIPDSLQGRRGLEASESLLLALQRGEDYRSPFLLLHGRDALVRLDEIAYSSLSERDLLHHRSVGQTLHLASLHRRLLGIVDECCHTGRGGGFGASGDPRLGSGCKTIVGLLRLAGLAGVLGSSRKGVDDLPIDVQSSRLQFGQSDRTEPRVGGRGSGTGTVHLGIGGC
ncbi:hypothetical protein PMAYCL1PPCAC_18835, partial [Pristionchus mayeri]